MAGEKLHCNLITPDRKVLDCDANFVAIPGHDGQFGFLKNRAPLLCKLGVGELRVESDDGTKRFFIDGGFAQMLSNTLNVLTERAEAAADIDPAEADAELRQALSLTATDAGGPEERDHAIRRARARKRFAEKRA
jgi:F-type H+-transporting ATPase subunit epsilon